MRKLVKCCSRAAYGFARAVYKWLPLPKRAKANIKDSLHKMRGMRLAMNRKMMVKPQDYKEYALNIFDTGKKGPDFKEYKRNEEALTDEDIKPIAFYLPQFYTFPENDEWWGKGFTEWTNVTKAVPQYIGHYQPHLPYGMPFYDLGNADIIRRQADLAKNYGIYGFCFHYYWFAGKRLLEKPLDIFLEAGDIDFPFCVNWANENWTRRWDGSDHEILIAQSHSDEDDEACIADICKYINDKRYIRIGGKPLVIIYHADSLPHVNRTIGIWRAYCRDNEIGDICIAGARTFNMGTVSEYDFDEIVEFPPHFISRHNTNIITNMKAISPEFNSFVFDMDEYISSKEYLKEQQKNVLKCAFPSWDNTPRKGGNASIYPMTPALYKQWLLDIMQYTKNSRPPGDRYVFINAWNEWAEGAHLEPCRRNGYSALQATFEAVIETRAESEGVLWR